MTDLGVGQASGLGFQSEDVEYLKHVNPASGFLPALFRAHIRGTNDRSLPIAIGLNGWIWATTTISKWEGKENYLSVLVPPAALKNWSNVIGVYRIEEPDGAWYR
jgi:hypothetical protein